MSDIIKDMLELFINTFKENNINIAIMDKAKKIEDTSDQMQEEISTYLAECTKHELSSDSSKGAAVMIRITNELESIGDSTFNLFLQLDRLKNDSKLNKNINKEIIDIYNIVNEFVEWNYSFISNNISSMNNENLQKSIEYERKIDDIRNKLLDSSRVRLTKGSDTRTELIFMDIVKHLEHIGDYSLNISQALEQIE